MAMKVAMASMINNNTSRRQGFRGATFTGPVGEGRTVREGLRVAELMLAS
ncbi:hypothetical protein HHS34_012320 [Acidithiobacillus montserratensis]|uniref:Uncharacterized protein n=1 Tax=Acidithiobacillus montserratensis TaxID=2729135 RepID=A0ACD5HEY5_9PROT|nr:hypothetical protein [Acidithiobacillus montserratensis]